MKIHQTTAARLLEIVFEHHHIRTWVQGEKIEFDRNAAAKACGFTNIQRATQRHVEPCDLGCIKVQVRSANGAIQNREIVTLTQSGVLALVIHSNKPAARRFQRYLIDQVIPQLIKYGGSVEGTTPAERITMLHRCWRQERAALLVADAATLESSGLMTLQAFRTEHGIPALDGPAIGRRLQLLAKQDGTTPWPLLVAGHGQVNAWPRELLAAAVNSTTPRLF